MNSGNSYNRLTAGGSGISTSTNTSGIGPTGPTGPTGGTSVFTSNIQMSLPSGRTFGKYDSNALIQANGKTSQQVILDALRQAQDPAPNLSLNIASIPFYASSQNVTIALTAGIKNQGAIVDIQTLKWKKTGAADNTYGDLTIGNLHTINATVLGTTAPFTTGSLTYQYVITDSQGSIGTTTKTLAVAGYSQPNISLQLNTENREIGDVSTVISDSTVTKGSTNVPLVSGILEFMYNNNNSYAQAAAYIAAGDTLALSITHNPTILINTTIPVHTYPTSITYRVKAFDTYKNLTSQVASTSLLYTINFYPYIYYGAFDILDDSITSLDKIKTKSKTLATNLTALEIVTGTTNRSFVIALPSSKTLKTVMDGTFNLTESFNLSTFIRTIPTVNNSISIPYNVYICSVAQAYPLSTTFNITIS